MKFLELAKKRFSVRKYQTKEVEEEKLLKILEAGRVAPTGANTQPQRILAICSKEGLEKISKCANIYKAPVALIVCVDHSVTWKRPLDGKDIGEIDVSIVTDHMMLQATELELGTCWICYFDETTLRQEFNIPDNYEPLTILVIGYSAAEPASSDRHGTLRKSLDNTVRYESF
ncbi:FMN reductase [NAD(P)H] [Desulfosporosinus acididurans]|uniref:FMN reductase [NAD(P)H] n=1 Tax=Desulfosporosinus acididurans TaxID=476652 RepID=A0A0J1FT14_9FIRM|nr:nitroreductase family protein [Desulfosporosinus acididurans]KLU66610.1 FMN reductase [NAD(P)H] [Desulfosporosinus acididurans]